MFFYFLLAYLVTRLLIYSLFLETAQDYAPVKMIEAGAATVADCAWIFPILKKKIPNDITRNSLQLNII